jgi:hypothetical protein
MIPRGFAAGAALLAGATAVGTLPARALVFSISYDPSVGSAPSGFLSAFSDAIQLYQRTYTDPITINIDVGWGEIDGNPLSPDSRSQCELARIRFPLIPLAATQSSLLISVSERSIVPSIRTPHRRTRCRRS